MFVAVVGGAVAAVIGGLALKAIPGHPIAISLVCAALGMVVVFLACISWYGMILDYRNSAEGSDERAAYNLLRSNLRGVNKPEDTPFGEWYRKEVTRKLNGVAHWFGDTDHPNSERLCGHLGLYQARPLWTSNSYDKCLLLALLYPLLCLMIFWVINGATGSVEQALGLTENQSMPRRIVVVGGLLVFILLLRKGVRSESILSWLYLFGAFAFAFAFAVSFLSKILPKDLYLL